MGDGARKELGLFDATMLVMGGIIGVGIFFTPARVAELVPSTPAFFGMWVLGALVAMAGAATFAELGGTFPRYGGWFEFLREIYGPFVAFLFAWVILGVVATGAMAVVCSFGAETLLGLFGEVDPRAHLALAAGILLGLTALTLFGIKVGATFQNVCMVAKLTALGALAAGGFFFFTPSAGADVVSLPAGASALTWSGAFAASLSVLFSFGGWQHVCYVADAVRDPQRVIPKAILFGVLGVGVVYLVLNAAYVRVLGLDGVAHTPEFAAVVAERTFGGGAARALRAAMAVSAIGLCAVNVIVTPAIFVGMARGGLFFRSFGRLHARTGAPVAALCAQLVLALLYLCWMHSETLFGAALEGMDVDTLTGSVVFAEWFFHGLIAWGLIRLRKRRPELPRPYRSFAFPLAPAVYLVAAACVLAGNLALTRGLETAVGASVLAAGALIYAPWRRFFRRA
jgi:basic amino acid/polyamine antiporter, APA family